VRNCYSSDVERSQDSEASLVGTSGGACCRCFVRGSRRYPSTARDNQHVARLTYSAGGCPGGEQRETEPAPGSGIFTGQACSRALAGSESTAPRNRPGGDGCARRRTCRYHGDEQVQAGRVGGCLARIRPAVDAQDVSRCGIGACDSALLGPACVLTTAGSGAPTPRWPRRSTHRGHSYHLKSWGQADRATATAIAGPLPRRSRAITSHSLPSVH
jgi:hypothetical protein